MIEVVKNILDSNGYRLVDLELHHDEAEIYIYQPLEEIMREEYFVAVRLRNQTDAEARNWLEIKAEPLFEQVFSSGKVNNEFLKNCTMLLCFEEDKINRDTVLLIEEDQYNFKKNVISYYHEELADLKKYMKELKIESLNGFVINRMINSDEGRSFLSFKDNHKQQRNYYSLILKVVLKLPFFSYAPKEQSLVNLDKEIESSLTSDQFSIYNQLLSEDVEWSEENILECVERIWRA
ncbi:ABC-three component system middle component 1 [Vreelandella lutescens]|uniref:Uncharacterized protein n=1 Tax=Vreelandella lutescens TaxID=1602943 RepID=A0ABQ1P266_9GAMM|nr:ABC-three component system middle component 1 [Halomonas lutescens]GGC89481.1 hypothetical protein GCM10011382_19700 [Halomonas lutescens]